MTALAQLSAATPEWGSPLELVDLGHRALGEPYCSTALGCTRGCRFDVDPFSSPYWNEHTIRAHTYFTAERTSLDRSIDWGSGRGRTFIDNPPTGLVKAAWEWAVERWQAGWSGLWVGYSIEQLTYLQNRGLMYGGFRRAIPGRRLGFMRGLVGGVQQSLFDEPTETPAPEVGEDPTHACFVVLLPQHAGQVERFDRLVRDELRAVPW